jgi:Raf kinase inhibitor-like YbhB/YbcL family protein
MGLMDLTRPVPPDPYSLLPQVPSFTLTSTDLTEGAPIDPRLTVDGENLSPALAWSGFPEGTRSFVVNLFDPDAPTPAGYWHWTLVDVPASVTSLATGAATTTGPASLLALPDGAFQVKSDGGTDGYEGAGPPPGDRAHRYVFAVHALDVETLGLDASASATAVAFNALFHTLARATLTATYARPGADA